MWRDEPEVGKEVYLSWTKGSWTLWKRSVDGEVLLHGAWVPRTSSVRLLAFCSDTLLWRWEKAAIRLAEFPVEHLLYLLPVPSPEVQSCPTIPMERWKRYPLPKNMRGHGLAIEVDDTGAASTAHDCFCGEHRGVFVPLRSTLGGASGDARELLLVVSAVYSILWTILARRFFLVSVYPPWSRT
uniref:Agenet domain-containing protein n=1 Tax=Steinernema glaseri TaxID=37863 RepID=A0A1I7Z3B1_9BILA